MNWSENKRGQFFIAALVVLAFSTFLIFTYVQTTSSSDVLSFQRSGEKDLLNIINAIDEQQELTVGGWYSTNCTQLQRDYQNLGYSVSCNTSFSGTDRAYNVSFNSKDFDFSGVTGKTLGPHVLNSTDPTTNDTSEDLRAYFVSTGVTENLTVNYDWISDNSNGFTSRTASLARLNMPFDKQVTSTTAGAVKDYSTFENNGTRTGATWQNNADCGLTGGCFSFDGSGDYIEIGDTTTFRFLHGRDDTSSFQWSIEWWMQLPTPEPDALYVMASTGTVGSSASVAMDLWFDDRSSVPRSRTFALLIARGVGGQQVCCSTAFADNIYPNDANWHHVVVTYDQALANQNANVYIDGASAATLDKTGFTPSTANSANPLHLGIMGGETIGPLSGKLDNFRIYNHTLSSSQISANYNSGLPRYNITVSAETTTGDRWNVSVTPVDNQSSGAGLITNSVTIT